MSFNATESSEAEAVTRRRSYPSDVSERQWRKVQPLLAEPRSGSGRPRDLKLREILCALNYRWETGCVWRMLPHDFPPWGTVYSYHRAWERAGALEEIREALRRSR